MYHTFCSMFLLSVCLDVVTEIVFSSIQFKSFIICIILGISQLAYDGERMHQSIFLKFKFKVLKPYINNL